VKQHPPGFRAVWGTIGAAAVALLIFQAEHRPVGEATPRAGGTPTVTVRPSGTRPRPAAAASTPGTSVRAVAAAGGPGPAAVSMSPIPPVPTSSPASGSSPTAQASPSSSSTSPSTPPLSPTPARPLLAVSAEVAIPVRGATPIEVRAALVVPTGPPLLPNIDVSIGLPQPS
jgi:hypothetical protein